MDTETMSYSEFKAEYTAIFRRMMSYDPGQAGAGIYAERMAIMADIHPVWAEAVESNS